MLIDALGITPGECVAVVGAGGKTSLCWRLVQELAQRGRRVVFTTTTRIRQPAPGAFARLPGSDTSVVSDTSSWRTACLASAVDGAIDDSRVADSLMPAVHTKLAGFSAEAMCALRASLTNHQLPITLLVEADGARGLMLKAPAEYEPVIPPCTDVVCVVAHLDALGRPLDERVAHRVERIAGLTGARPGTAITPELIVALLSHPEGGLKGIPSTARRIAVLHQRGDELRADGLRIASELVTRGFDRVVVAALREERVVLYAVQSASSDAG